MTSERDAPLLERLRDPLYWGQQGMRIEAAEKIEQLQAALKPFANAAAELDGYPDNHPIGCDPCMACNHLTVGSIRAAQRALA